MDLYDCDHGLRAKRTSFESLRCAMGACAGSRNYQKVLNSLCSPCDNYVVNAQRRDQEELAKPIPKRA